MSEGIQNTPDWKNLSVESAQKVWQEIRRCVLSFTQREEPDEADTETDLIEPVLKLLGFSYSRQKPLDFQQRRNVPDYVLFATGEAKESFDRSPERRWQEAIAILEAKRWGRLLDRSDRSDPIDPRIPSSQMLRYLSTAEVVSNGRLLWGMLTNGRVWRLYYHRAPSRIDGYVEFDLLELAQQEDSEGFEQFKRFYFIFRKEAFIPAAYRPHRTFLEIALEEGKRWEARVSETLKETIFTDIFPSIAQGFLHSVQERGTRVDASVLDQVYHHTLVFLYRLLFLFYAEDRDLLPVRTGAYFQYSLSRIRSEIAEKMGKSIHLSKKATCYYDCLRTVFAIVHSGDPSIGVPAYNGALFDPSRHPFLETYAVPDFWLVPALDKLSRDYAESPPKRINYRDLSVRQLGSIYEGLLEFRLKIAEEDLVVRKRNGREIYVAAKDSHKAILHRGMLYLTNDRAERKATGSYYTPDYVVQYIVRSTVEPYVEHFLSEFEQWRQKLQRIRSKAELRKRIENSGIYFDPKQYDEEGRIDGEKTINEYRNALLQLKDPAQRLLSLKIVDPAMGSGHFLVAAVDYLADRILEILSETSEQEYFRGVVYRSPLLQKLEEIRFRILSRAQKEGYAIDEAKLEDRNLIKRILLKRCIYGVDVNPLAVELAKVSLWLHTFTVGAPLSFLDHHLKCGNSLVGADPEEVRQVLGSSLMGQHFHRAFSVVDTIQKLQELTDADISEVEESARLYEQVSQNLSALTKALDLYTAEFFVELKKVKSYLQQNSNRKNHRRSSVPWAWAMMEVFDPLKVVEGKLQTANGEEEMTPDDFQKLQERLQLARKKRFFHWKLEFPEVWYNQHGVKANPGFDVVLGNPPYIRIQEMRRSHADEVDYYNQVFKSPQGSYDIYILFVEKGLILLKEGGVLGFILPNKFTKLDFAQKFRQMVRPFLWKFIDFRDRQVFPEQTTYTSLLFLRKFSQEEAPDTCMVAQIPSTVEKPLPVWLKEADKEMQAVPLASLGEAPWILVSGEEAEIMRKMEKRGKPLGQIVEQIFQGLITSADPIYILEKREDKGAYYRVFSKASQREFLLEKDLLKPLISGEDIERYYVRMSNKLLLFPYKLLPEGGAELITPAEFQLEYPNVWEYLKMHEEALRNREGGKFGDSEWYRLSRTQNLDKHERRKFGVAQTVKRLEVFLDAQAQFYFHNVRVNGILVESDSPYDFWFLLAILNSRAEDVYFKCISVPHRGGHFAANKQFLEPLPIPIIDFATRDQQILRVLQEAYNGGKNPISRVRSLPSSSAVLHDFLAFLAKQMAEMQKLRYLLELFAQGRLESGTRERVRVLKELTLHPEWEENLNSEVQREIARDRLCQKHRDIERTDLLIDQIVYHLYGLSEKDRRVIERVHSG